MRPSALANHDHTHTHTCTTATSSRPAPSPRRWPRRCWAPSSIASAARYQPICVWDLNRLLVTGILTPITTLERTKQPPNQAKPGVGVIRAVSPYSLPASVARVIALVAELLRFPTVRHLSSTPNRLSSNANTTTTDDDPFNACGKACAGFTTPTVLAQRYGFDAEEAAVGEVAPGNAMSVAEVRVARVGVGRASPPSLVHSFIHSSMLGPHTTHTCTTITYQQFQLQYYDRRDLLRFGAQCGVDSVDVDKVRERNQKEGKKGDY